MAFMQDEAAALSDAAFTTKLERFIAGVNKVKAEANLHTPTVIKLRSGKGKYLALDNIEYAHDDPDMQGEGKSTSIFCFIAAEDNTTKVLGVVKKGDVMKPATFRRPAKHARGNIYDEANGLGGVDTKRPIRWTGPEYLQ